MYLTGLLDLLTRNPAFVEWLQTLERVDASAVPQALLAAARPFVVAGLKHKRPGPLLFVTARSEMAQQLVDQLHLWLPPVDEGGPPIYLFADPDALPYERIPWSGATRQRRLTALAALQSRMGPAPVIVASARALMQKTLPPRELRLALRAVKVAGIVRLEQLVANWVQTGYNPAEVVEEPGTFARRGGIVDIWPPNLPLPVRIDLFGDEVESLRLFDPTSQRTVRQVQSVEIGPGSEALSKYGPSVLERLGVKGGSLQAPENVGAGAEGTPLLDPKLLLAVREEMRLEVEHLANSQSFHGIEWYLPYFYEQPSSLIDHLPDDATLVIDDALDLLATLHELEQQAESLRQELLRSGELPEHFQRSYLTADGVRARLLARGPALLGYGDLDGKAGSANTPLARSFAPGPRFGGKTKEIGAELVKLHNGRSAIILATRQAARLRDLLQELHLPTHVQADLGHPPAAGTITLVQGVVGEGFVLKGLRTAVTEGDAAGQATYNAHFYTDAELFGWSKPQARARSRPHSTVAPEIFFADVKPGDFVVHIEHGIGRYEGLVPMELAGIEREYLLVTYARGDKLYVPVHQADRLSRYVGTGDIVPPVNRLGTADWQMVKERAKRAVAEIADELLKLYAERELVAGHVYSPDGPWQDEMESTFQYQETDDQLHAVEAVKRDMESNRPMDRLVCGDVGYGKTEVAIRAAFKAITDGKQVAFLVPTTVLAQQHFRTIGSRLARFPVRVEMLSRFRTPAQQQAVIDGLREGAVDLVIGTHRLLSNDVEFRDLGLLIIDEEQRFGVAQKEQLKQLRTKVDVLTLSATPIPRTLHMSLSGIRDMSTINTPPKERQPIHTVLAEYDDLLVKQAIQRELARKGQVFVVNDRVRGIQALADRIHRLVPDAVVAAGHGQMPERALEEVMLRFAEGDIDVLVATTIIENGLDIPNANTIIINRANHFGLAQLYQLRGRVGRSAQRGHCYLLYEKHVPLTFDARRRLEAILESSEELGAGFRIAMRDLEIRGAGDLLGARQHGHIDSVGFDLYTRLLAQAINDARRKKTRFEEAVKAQEDGEVSERSQAVDGDGKREAPEATGSLTEIETPATTEARPAAAAESLEELPFDLEDPLSAPVQLDLPVDARIPASYVEDENLRLQFYRRIAGITHAEALDEMRRELVDRFGKDPETGSVPPEIEELFFQIRVKILATRAGIDRIGRELDNLVLRSETLENMDRKAMERRLQLALGRISEDDATFVPEEAARVGRRAIYLPIDDAGQWRQALLRTLEIMAVG
ncbi:MAG: transcription-repair coupling factor [Caldilineaceae bacterium]|nr:transcription-repair coupling factor [Caldilineaceae bacterium]